MTIKLYDLAAGNPKIMFGPFAWRSRMALLHKGLDFEVLPWRFSDNTKIGPNNFASVPVLQDGDTWVGDSWDIALYLDKKYPDRPTLMNGAESEAYAQFVMGACGSLVFPAAIPVAVYQAFQILDEASKPYFRESREKMFGARLEDIHVDQEKGKAGLAAALKPFNETLAKSPFLGGNSPTYADYVLFGVLKWVDIVSSYRAIDESSEVGKWFVRLEGMYGGYARDVPTVRNMQ
jgi:glutathione S-transferase